MLTLKKNKQKFLIFCFLLTLFLGAFYFGNSLEVIAADATGDTLADFAKGEDGEIDGIVSTAIASILIGVLALMGILISMAATLFNWVLDPENMKYVLNGGASNSVYLIWATVRDVLNIAFILVLLFSAFATVFQVDKYSYKNVLLRLVLMALLVNFSFPITRFIIDFSNSMMYFLLSGTGLANNGTIFGQITADSPLHNIIYPKIESTSISYLLASIIFVWIYAITLLIIAGLFVIRTVALTIIIIFSSVAFTGSLIPFTSSYASKWWDNLFKYAFFGPVMIFMIIVATKMLASFQNTPQMTSSMESYAQAQSINPSFIAAISLFSIPIIILWAGIIFAQSMSLAGSGAVIKRATGFNRAAAWGGKALARKFERGIAKGKHTWWMSPTAFKQAWKENTAESERKAFKPATGAWRDKLNRAMSLGQEKTKFRDTATQTNIATKQKELESTSENSEYLMNEFRSAEKVRDSEKMSAILRIMFKNNDQNEFMKLSGKKVNPFEMRREIYSRLKQAGMNEQDIMKQMSDLSEIAISKGNFGNYGMAFYDPKLAKYRLAKDDAEQIGAAHGKSSNIKAQTKSDIWHWNSFLDQNVDGSSGDIHQFGYKQLEELTSSEIGQINRARTDFFNRLGDPKILQQMRDHANKLNTRGEKEKSDMITEFARRIEGFSKDPKFKP